MNTVGPTSRDLAVAVLSTVEPLVRVSLLHALDAFWRAVLTCTADGDKNGAVAQATFDRGSLLRGYTFQVCIAAWWPQGGDSAIAAAINRTGPGARWLAEHMGHVARGAITDVTAMLDGLVVTTMLPPPRVEQHRAKRRRGRRGGRNVRRG